MDRGESIKQLQSDASAFLAYTPEVVGHFLLVFATVELLSMLFTRYAWTWDRFPHGSMDLESSPLFLVDGPVLRHHRRLMRNLRIPKWRLSLPIFDTEKSATTFGTGV